MSACTCFLLWWALPAALCADLIPRITFSWGDSRRNVSTFRQTGVFHYDTFLMSPDEDTLYVGARDTLLSLNIRDPGHMRLQKLIPWKSRNDQINNCISKAKSNLTECFNFNRVLWDVNQTHLYTCGTHAFSPTCAYIDVDSFSLVANSSVDARGQSPFDPVHKHTAIMVDGELYTGTMNNFQGNKPVILRNLGNRTSLKTDESLGWLHTDAAFVASFNIQHPEKPADGKVYFFFEETAKEFDFFEKLTVSRVARVCKSDVGGDKVLQKKWTTFLKAQLSCSNPEHFPFSVIHHAFYLPGKDGKDIFYGVFTSQWQVGGSDSSAVCAFDQKDIEDVFDGSFKELNKDSSRWITYTGPISNPRPGSCTVGSSSDKDLTFMKDHFLMDRKVEAVGKHPVLIKQNVVYTRIVVDPVMAISGEVYNVLYLGTDKGFLHKAVLVEASSHIIEEIQLFQKPEPVKNLRLSAKKGVLYVGYSNGVLQVPLANCSIYRSCFDCILARDPYCAWDMRSQTCWDIRESSEQPQSFVQDIAAGNPNVSCVHVAGKGRAVRPPSVENPNTALVKDQNLTVPLNSVLQLHCPRVSAIANYSWTQNTNAASEQQLIISGEYLVIVVNKKTLGLYECWASEKGFRYQVARYSVMDVDGRDGNQGGSEDDYLELDNTENGWRSSVGNYWSQFVAVTVFLSLTLIGIFVLVLYTYCERRKSKAKVQGCSTPEASKISNTEKPQEKTPLTSDHRMDSDEHQFGNCQESADHIESCCVPVENDKRDMENNCVSLFAANGDAPRDPAGKDD
ncbi:semaphorin-4A [Ambystoma mexicanum]|uniref:semaphorin-4A n=1 Tax=Ambystoma mexicanum TaxID=8296 RepID=UPI0037E7AA32